ncbi:hypothetical protein SAMN04489729_6990 [Amycolatopsis lurida]|uniref:Uncharacterized protein n=1 Tax=Amycolatopsis lurida NRRL 2430 TaxID=1460371 RepID=A0A2P2FFB6_AMYLU|nr:hypothetical protein [Amycolatopsis lurida]KFU75416.1 hypothetical protein BB31_41660 [Amycolatopsis lurida NRRL 2430]SEE29704.1 hypothetical protein SAMN04489729_6990 [Amycolatopsis lurida]
MPPNTQLTEDRFSQVSQAARRNIRTALDLIAIHSEQPVRGPQPRSSLNPFTVLAAVGAWERLIADLTSAASQTNWRGPGGHKTTGAHWPSAVDAHMISHQLLAAPLTSRWEAAFPARWKGITPLGWTTVRQTSPAADRDKLLAYITASRRARNAAAHYALVENASAAAQDMDSEGWYPWQSDAHKPSLPAGFARGLAAVYLQLIDCTIDFVAHERNWDAGAHRPPADWFRSRCRESRYDGVALWAGTSLHRVSA